MIIIIIPYTKFTAFKPYSNNDINNDFDNDVDIDNDVDTDIDNDDNVNLILMLTSSVLLHYY